MPGRKIEIEILGKGDSAKRTFREVGNEADGFGSKIKGAGGALGDMGKIAGGVLLGGAIAQGPGLLIGMAKAAAEDEAATMRLGPAHTNAGGDFDANIAKVNARIEAAEDLAFTDDQVRDSFQQLLAATGDTDEALRRQALAMDFARGAGIPLEQASKLLGKVTEENVEVFKRMGITIGEGATEAEAFAVIQSKFAGQSEAYAQSTAGQFEVASIKMAEAKEQIGAALLPAMAGLATFLTDTVIPAIEKFANWWGEVVQPKIEAFVAWVQPKLEEFGAYIQAEFAKFQIYYESDIKPALDNIQTAIEALIGFIREHWPEIEAIVRPVLEEVQNIVVTVFGVIREVFQIFIDLLGGDFSGAWKNFQELIRVVMDGIKASIENRLELIKALMEAAWSAIKFGAKAAWEGMAHLISDLIDRILGWVRDLPGQFYDAALAMGQALGDGLKAMAGYVFNKAKELGSSAFEGVKAGAGKLWPGSPSKAGLEVGEALGTGIIAGFEGQFGNVQRYLQARAAGLAVAAQIYDARSGVMTQRGVVTGPVPTGQHRTEGGSGNVGRSANPQPGGGGGNINLYMTINGVVARDLAEFSKAIVSHLVVAFDRELGKQWRVT